MILMVAVMVNGDRDKGRGSGGSDNGNDGNGNNSEGSSRNGTDWEVEQIKGMDGEGTMMMTVELGMEVTPEGI
jgi:hypothetical protein